MEGLRFPRLVEDAPGAAGLLREFIAGAEPLWSGGTLLVPRVEITSAVEAALKSSLMAGQLVRGLENAERALSAEALGLNQVDRTSGVARGGRVSRLLVLADDGAERFYRSVEALVRRHAPRVLGLRLAADERVLGQLLFGPDQVARLLLVEHKSAVSAVLLALVAQQVADGRDR